MIRVVLRLVALVSALLVQAVVAPALALGDARPPIVLLVVIAFALAEGPMVGTRYGFLAGLTVDLLGGSTQLVGVTTLGYMLTGYASGLAQPYLVSSGVVGELVAGAVAAAAGDLLVTMLGVLLGMHDLGRFAAVIQVLTAAAYGAVAVPLLARLARRVARASDRSDRSIVLDDRRFRW